MVREYVENSSPSASLAVTEMILIRECFAVFKNMVLARGGGGGGGGSGGSGGGEVVSAAVAEELREARLQIEQKDAELEIFMRMVDEYKRGRPLVRHVSSQTAAGALVGDWGGGGGGGVGSSSGARARSESSVPSPPPSRERTEDEQIDRETALAQVGARVAILFI